MRCSIKLFSTLLAVLFFAAKNSKNRFTVVRRHGAEHTERVEFAVGEEVEVYIQKENKRLRGKILRLPHKRSVHVRVPGRGDIWIHKSNLFKIKKED